MFFGVGSKKYFVVRDPELEQVSIATVDLSPEELAAEQLRGGYEQLTREIGEGDATHKEQKNIMEMQTEKSDKTCWWSMDSEVAASLSRSQYETDCSCRQVTRSNRPRNEACCRYHEDDDQSRCGWS